MFKFVVLALCVAVASAALTPEQISALQASWAPYTANPQQTGTQLFSGFLAANPNIQAQFPKFATVPAADLPNNAALQAHALKIFNVINDVVQSQNWPEVEQLSVFHKGIGQTNQAYFQAFGDYFLNFLELTPAQRTLWEAALARFYQALYSSF